MGEPHSMKTCKIRIETNERPIDTNRFCPVEVRTMADAVSSKTDGSDVLSAVPRIITTDCNGTACNDEIPPLTVMPNVTYQEESSPSCRETAASSCFLCPLHCSKQSNKLPRQNGLYGKIAELTSEIQQKHKSHVLDRATLMKQINELEALLSTTKDKNSTLISQNHLLESKVKYWHKVANAANQATKLDSRWLFKDSNQDFAPKRSSLRRTKSQEIVGVRQSPLGVQPLGIGLSNQEQKIASVALCTHSDASSTSSMNVMTPIQEADEDSYWAKEKEVLLQNRKLDLARIHDLDKQNRHLRADLQDAHEQLDLLEFRLIELEEHCSFGKGTADVKQFRDHCVGTTDNSTSGGLYLKECPEEKGGFMEFCDEKANEIKGKILEIVRFHPVNSVDKTTLVQAVAVLELCQKLISRYKSERTFSDIMAASLKAPGALAEMGVLEPPVSLLNGEGAKPICRCNTYASLATETASDAKMTEDGRLDVPELQTKLVNSTSSMKPLSDCFDELPRLLVDSVVESNVQPWQTEVCQSTRCGLGDCDRPIAAPSFSSVDDEKDWIAMQAEVKRLKELLERLQCEMQSKETEYCLKVEALKCDKEDCVGLLERRLNGLQERELQSRNECEALARDKSILLEKLRDQTLTFDWQKDEMLKRLEECQQEVERLKSSREFSKVEAECGVCARGGLGLSDKVDEAQRAVVKHRETIRCLKGCLSAAMSEVDSALICRDGLSAAGDCDEERFLFKIKELVAVESEARQKLCRLEKKDAAYRETLDEADRIMADVEHNYQERLEEMERSEQQLRQRIRHLEQGEKRLNDMLKESSTRRHPEVKKVGELLERVLEAEASELHLRQKLSESALREEEVKGRLAVADEARRTAERQLEEQEELMLQNNQRALVNRIAELEASESALRETLQKADSILTAREQKFVGTIDELRTEIERYKRSLRPEVTMKRSKSAGDVFSVEVMDQMMTELQQLNDRETDLESLKGNLSSVVACVNVCSHCQPLCVPTLNHLETQVQQLHEIVFGHHVPLIDQCVIGPFSHPAESRVQVFEAADNVSMNDASPATSSIDGDDRQLDTGEFQSDKFSEEWPRARINSSRQGKKSKSQVMKQQPISSVEHVALNSLVCLTGHQEEKNYASQNAEIATLALNVSHLQAENEDLKRNLWRSEVALKASVDKANKISQELEVSRRKIGDLDSKISFLNRQLHHIEDVQNEKDALLQLLRNMEEEMQKKKEVEHRVCAENLHLHHKVEGLRERLGSLQSLRKDHKTLLAKFATSEKKLSSTESSHASIQLQSCNLQKECLEKDQIIEKLKQELHGLRRSIERHSCFCNLRPLKTHSVSQSSDDSGIRDCSGSSSLESEISEDCLLIDSSSCGHVSEDSRSCSPASSSNLSSCHSTATTDRLSPLGTVHSKKSTRHSTKESSSRIPRYTALCKHGSIPASVESDPSKQVVSASASSRNGPRSTQGPIALSSGKKLVQTRRQRLTSASSSDGSTCSDFAVIGLPVLDQKNKAQARKPPVVPTRSASRMKVKSAKPFTKIVASAVSAVPESPSKFHVTRRVGLDGLVVAWTTPAMDSTGCSNGCTVSGYQIFVNGVLHQNVRSAHRTKALLNNLDFSSGLPLEISIQALSLTGQRSSLEATRYTGDCQFPLPEKATGFGWERVERKCRKSDKLNDVFMAGSENLIEPKTLRGYFSPLGRLVEV